MRREEKKTDNAKIIVLCLLFLFIAIPCFTIFIRVKSKSIPEMDEAQYAQYAYAPTSAKDAQREVVDYQIIDESAGLTRIDEAIYRRKTGITNLMFIGLDNQDPPNADFLMLVSFDENKGVLNVININPMMLVQGTTTHSTAMDMTIAQSAQLGIDNLIQQCAHIFYGEIIDYYIAMNMNDTAHLLLDLGIATGDEIVLTAQASQKMVRIDYGKQFIDGFLQFIKESEFSVDFLTDTWEYIEEHSQNNAEMDEMGQLFVETKTFEIRRSWDTPALEFMNDFNLILPQNKPLVINTFFTSVVD